MLVKARANYRKQKTFDGPFAVHVLMHAVKEARQVIRRATPARIAEATEAIDRYMAERPKSHVGDIARTHWAISQSHAAFGTMSTSRQEGRGADSAFGTLTVQLNGSRDMQLTANVSELRTLLKLQNYSLITEGLFSHFQPPPEPALDMKYV
ncbi:hypothetical protein GN958_ATG16417 [Phytophthora infestans]|uniref:Uncharacterized protein n=1 Tax=Phytophthora infestans TaxID=4787 RepID=A0A8S9U417_PHYIN|nr:hypothetical protein GN958_ATG16417 [Phytophthora infestans]